MPSHSATQCSHGPGQFHVRRSAEASDTCSQSYDCAAVYPTLKTCCCPAPQVHEMFQAHPPRCLICKDTEAIGLQRMHGLFGKVIIQVRGALIIVRMTRTSLQEILVSNIYLSGGGSPSLISIFGGDMNATALMQRLPPSASTTISVGLQYHTPPAQHHPDTSKDMLRHLLGEKLNLAPPVTSLSDRSERT